MYVLRTPIEQYHFRDDRLWQIIHPEELHSVIVEGMIGEERTSGRSRNSYVRVAKKPPS